MRMDRRTFAVTLLAGVATSPLGHASEMQVGPRARNVVLVHGAYADGSSWSEVIPLLQRAGLNVTAVQNPLTSLADDVAATRRILALQDGPAGPVGPPRAGARTPQASGDPQVPPLVYVAARAPDAG